MAGSLSNRKKLQLLPHMKETLHLYKRSNYISDLEFQSFKRSFLHECEQSSRLRHPNIVCFFGIYHPSDARVPSLVMERLHCSLISLLENNPVVPIEIIIKDVTL